MQFRHDINGLRALAVLLLYVSLQPSSGYQVDFRRDVFFVISGFLMTAIIFNGIEKNNFNLFKFYTARANSIIPVLALMSTVLLVFGWFYLTPADYEDLGRQVERSSSLFQTSFLPEVVDILTLPNIPKWLLHTWSLSVEWQFYIFFPIIIITLKKYLSLRKIKYLVISLFLINLFTVFMQHIKTVKQLISY